MTEMYILIIFNASRIFNVSRDNDNVHDSVFKEQLGLFESPSTPLLWLKRIISYKVY